MSHPEDPEMPMLGLSAALESALADAEQLAREKAGEPPPDALTLPPEPDDEQAAVEPPAPALAAGDDEDDDDDLFAGMDDEPAASGEAAAASTQPPAQVPKPEDDAARVLREAAARVRSVASGGELELLRNQVKHLRDRLKDEDGRSVRAERQLEIVTNDLKQTRKRSATVAEREDELNNRIERLKNELPQKTRTEVFSALLPAVDSTDLLVKNLLSDESLSADARRAVEILEADWKRAFANLQIQAFDAVGQKFDPVVHEAISEVESDDIPPGMCVRQVGRGYLMEHRLLRSAQVVVSKKPEDSGE